MADVNLTGRLARNIQSFDNRDGSKTHILTVARPRNYKDRNGNYGADFVQVKAFTNTEKAHNFYMTNMTKGTLVQLTGDFRSSVEEKNGEKVYYVDVIVDDINPFLERRTNSNQRQNQQAPADVPVQQTVQQQQAQPNYNYAPQANYNQAPPAHPNNMPQGDPFFQ